MDSSTDAVIDNGGTAIVNATGPVCSDLYLGTTGAGAIQMSGGSLSPSVHEYIGYNSQGTFTQSGGTNTVPDATLAYLYLGFNAGSSGTYTLSDTGQFRTV